MKSPGIVGNGDVPNTPHAYAEAVLLHGGCRWLMRLRERERERERALGLVSLLSVCRRRRRDTTKRFAALLLNAAEAISWREVGMALCTASPVPPCVRPSVRPSVQWFPDL